MNISIFFKPKAALLRERLAAHGATNFPQHAALESLAIAYGFRSWHQLAALTATNPAHVEQILPLLRPDEARSRRIAQALTNHLRDRYRLMLRREEDPSAVVRCGEMRAVLGKPSEVVVRVVTSSGKVAGWYLSAIGRSEHDSGISPLARSFGAIARDDSPMLSSEPYAVRSCPDEIIFRIWNSNTRLYSGPRGILASDSHLRMGKDFRSLDSLLNQEGCMPYVRSRDGEGEPTSDPQPLHACWSNSAFCISAVGSSGCAELDAMRSMLQSGKAALCWASPPDALGGTKKGLYIVDRTAARGYLSGLAPAGNHLSIEHVPW